MKRPYHLFEVFGIELEYMLVSKDTLSIKPAVDELLKRVSGEFTTDYVDGNTGWANELVLHVMEMRTNDPVSDFNTLPGLFQESVNKANSIAESMGARLMPSSMHPWMNPITDTQLWPHEYSEVYQQFNRIFNCHRHGWANLQSCQLNLPFANDAEFAQLHSAIRVLLPILPGLASSSPIVEQNKTMYLNNRLQVYKSNAINAPLVAGDCIPEILFTKKDYQEKLLKKIYTQIKPLDAENILQYEWLNARGAIARFDRNAIEIRVLDTQECPQADIAISYAIAHVLQQLMNERFSATDKFNNFAMQPLKKILDDHIRDADEAIICDTNYLSLFGIKEKKISSRELWAYLIRECFDSVTNADQSLITILKTIRNEGVLSRRILKALKNDFSIQNLQTVYGELCDCLAMGKLFHA